ncbi:MAG: TrkA family potassium uptake protein [Muribaculaceae bacterium]|nr:TrkA family potassium uptake protein [Muribaculaceae bacterium]
MRYLVIGLGIYGSNLARNLTEMGHEVIGVDINQTNIDEIKDYISTVYLIDSTEESALSVLPLRNVDVVVVAIGENFGASVRTVALLKKMGVKCLYARAIDKLHESILEGFDIQRIITPEQRAARDLAHEMELGARIQSLEVDDTHFVIKFEVPAYFVGLEISDMKLDENFRLHLVAVCRLTGSTNILGVASHEPEVVYPSESESTLRIEHGDILTVYGSLRDFRAMYRHIR